MPFFIKLIRWYYIFLTVCAILAPLKYSIIEFMPAFALMWASYFLFKEGCKKGLKTPVKINGSYHSVELSKWFFIFTVGMIAFIPLYVRFYTGGNLAILALSFYGNVGADSNYQEYQRYFMENNLDQFSLSKLPYILSYGLTKLLFYYFVFSYISYSRKISFRNIILLAILFLLYSMVGMARGTSFENFEILILLMFATLVRAKIINNRNFYTRRQMGKVLIVVVLIGTAFIISKSLRSGGDALDGLEGPTNTLLYDGTSPIMSIAPTVGKIALGFTGYFTFGLYFTSELFWKFWMGSATGFLDMLFPFFAPYLDGIPNYRTTLTNMGIDCGACWDPDFTSFSYYLGVPIVLLLVYYLGVLAGKSYNKTCINRDVGECMVLYMIVYEMISLHVGNFLVVSSSNKIMLVIIIIIMASNMFLKYRIR